MNLNKKSNLWRIDMNATSLSPAVIQRLLDESAAATEANPSVIGMRDHEAKVEFEDAHTAWIDLQIRGGYTDNEWSKAEARLQAATQQLYDKRARQRARWDVN